MTEQWPAVNTATSAAAFTMLKIPVVEDKPSH